MRRIIEIFESKILKYVKHQTACVCVCVCESLLRNVSLNIIFLELQGKLEDISFTHKIIPSVWLHSSIEENF